ncbi:uncharacterized protein IL334_004393 [Kwoniella shivajii]|uniref:Arrestin C-terminal-like domain-containing protein n=1 Tax=Kwoniella shivajii TaxID=564305 RepID=A0ABZ1D481_9TREE|nr:hypothetical protein IL334_004393 [Kwoniella shivajii]
MKSLPRSISSRSNSTSANDDNHQSTSKVGRSSSFSTSSTSTTTSTSTSNAVPVLPPVITGVSLSSISETTRSIPIPLPNTIRRSSEPVQVERWARPTLPSYAVSRSRVVPPISINNTNNSNNAPLPDYEYAISPESTNISISASAVRDQSRGTERFMQDAVREYFGTSHTSIRPMDQSSLEIDTSEENGASVENGHGNENGGNRNSTSNSNEEAIEEEEEDETVNVDDGYDDDDDDPLIPRRRIFGQAPQPARRNTFTVQDHSYLRPDLSNQLSSSLGNGEGYIDLPIPTSEPPIYSPSLGRDELRLISTVHLSSDHPAAAYFNAIAQSPPPPAGPPIGAATVINAIRGIGSGSGTGTINTSTGGKKLKMTITRGGIRMNANGTGPLYIRLPREGWVEGTVEVGKVDRAIGLEISIIGMINVSYYVRGQYTVLDTLPLARNKAQLFPPEESLLSSGPSGQPANQETQETAQSSSAPHVASTSSAEQPKTKDGQPLITPNSSFEFSLQMPSTHFKDSNGELPPTCDLQQLGMQASVDYVLRVKLVRKGLRFNETLTVPIVYQPRAYIPPRRLRALTLDDPLNPGWRTIQLSGGKPKTKTNLPNPVGTTGPGVDVTLLLPSPPILFIPNQGELPKFPFHLHFHSTLPHPLSTFSNPMDSRFVIRLTRVLIFRIGIEKEVRRIEIPTEVEIWQEGGERITLSSIGENTSDMRRGSTVSGPVQTATASGSGSGGDGLSSSLPSTVNTPTGTTENGGSGGAGGPLRRLSSAGSGLAESPRRKSFLSDRRGSFSLLRRNSTSTSNANQQTPNPSGSGSGSGVLSPPSNNISLPPIIDEDHQSPIQSRPEMSTSPTSASVLPINMDSTDVHLQGSMSIKTCSNSHADVLRRLIQSFIVPEMTLTYVLEIGIEPKKGAVKENFQHIWGGGVVEVVLGRRE